MSDLREQLEAAFEADDQKVTPEETSLVSEVVPDSEPIVRARDCLLYTSPSPRD